MLVNIDASLPVFNCKSGPAMKQMPSAVSILSKAQAHRGKEQVRMRESTHTAAALSTLRRRSLPLSSVNDNLKLLPEP